MKKDDESISNKQNIEKTTNLEKVEKEKVIEEEQDISPKKGPNKKLVIAVSSVASLFLLIAIIFGVSSFKRSQTIKQADSLISMEKFEDAIAIYDQVLIKKYIPAIINKRDIATDLMESSENLEKGIEAFDDDNKNKAIKYLSKVPKTDKKRYKQALEILDDLEDAATLEVEELIEEGKLDEASKLISSYSKLYPDSVDIHNAKEDIISKRSEAENKAKQAEQDKQNKAAADAKASQNRAQSQANQATSNMKKDEARNVASYIIGTTRSITSKDANLRSSPTLNGGIQYTLSRGDRVYIQSTQIESSNRIWCYVRDQYSNYGWISYNTMNNTM